MYCYTASNELTKIFQLKFQLDLKTIQFNKNEVVLVSKFKNETSHFYFVKPKNLKLNQEEIRKVITPTKGGFNIELTSKILQKDVLLFTKTKGYFSNNFFDLLPNQPVIIYFKTESKSLDELQLKSFSDFIG